MKGVFTYCYIFYPVTEQGTNYAQIPPRFYITGHTGSDIPFKYKYNLS